jgi:transposase
MTKSQGPKRVQLREADLLHPQPDCVRDPLFEEMPEFFDAEDLLQVRYEILRAHLVKHDAIRAICHRFGVSRQTFYNLQAKFQTAGTAGLLPKQPGPKGPRKLTTQVLDFVSEGLDREQATSAKELVHQIRNRFGITLHRRTLEKLVRDLRRKKNTEP